MGGYQNYGPLLGPLTTRCCIILRTQKGTISRALTASGRFGRVVPSKAIHSVTEVQSMYIYIYMYVCI